MPLMKTVFAEKLEGAINEVMAAENALESVLRTIEFQPRAEKTTISDAVQVAFERLRVARRELIELRELAEKDD
jgi:hypothetical protein